MSYILNVPFASLTLAGGNARTKNNPHYSTVSVGGKPHWGSNWNYTEKETGSSTVYNVGKIGIKLADLGLPSRLPMGTKIYVEVKSAAKWCGAGYIRGHVSFEDLTLNQTVEWYSEGGLMVQQSALTKNRIIQCTSDYGWTTDSSIYYKGNSPQWVGTFAEGLELDNKDILYIYMIDTVYNFGNPGSTTFYFKDSTFKVWFDLPFTSVGEPQNFSFVDISGEGEFKEVAYNTKIKLKWEAATEGNNNPVNGYKLWYKSEGQEAPFDTVATNTLEYEYTGYDKIPSMVKGKNYQIGIQTLATHEQLDSEIIYLDKQVKVLNSAPIIKQVSTNNKLKLKSISSVISVEVQANDEDLKTEQGKELESLGYFYFVAEPGIQNNQILIQGTHELAQVTLPNSQPFSISSNKISNTTESLKIEGIEIEKIVEGEIERAPSIYVFVIDGDGVPSIPMELILSINSIPEIEAYNFNFSYEEEDYAISFDQSRIYLKKINSLGFSLNDRIIESATLYLGENEIQNIETKENIKAHNVIFDISLVNLKQVGAGNQIKFKISCVDEYGDTFDFISLNNFYCPKDMLTIPYVFNIEANERPEEVNFIYLREGKGQNNTLSFSLELTGEDIETTWSLYESKRPKAESNYIINTTSIASKTFNSTINSSFKNSEFSRSFEYDVDYQFSYKLTNKFEEVGYKICVKRIEDKEYKTFSVLPKFNIATADFDQTKWTPIESYINNKGTEDGDSLVKFTASYITPNDLGFNSYTITASLNNESPIEIIKDLKAAFESEESSFQSGIWKIETNRNNEITFQAKNLEVFKLLKKASNQDFDNVTYTITAKNAYGISGVAKTSTGYKIITQHKPTLPKNFKLNPIINSGREQETLFNFGDTITFEIEGIRPSDYNDFHVDAEGNEVNLETIKNYKIFYRNEEGETWTELTVGNYNYTETDFIKYENEGEIDPETQTAIQFAIAFGDDRDKWSDLYIVKNIDACRVKNPEITIRSAESINGILTINLTSSDLGGNNYNSENFWRSKEEIFAVQVEAGSVLGEMNRLDGVTLSGVADSEKKEEGAYLNSYLNKNLTYTINLNDPTLINAEKIYLKATITIQTNSQVDFTISSTSSLFLLYTNPPTMAHRSHWVGINTTEKIEDEIFKISEFKNKKIIRLVGTHASENSYSSILSQDNEILKDKDGLLLKAINNGSSPREINEIEEIIVEIDLGSGIISSNNYSLDLRTGKFIGKELYGTYYGDIDGGSW